MKLNRPDITPGSRHYEKEPNGLTFSVWAEDDTRVAECETEAESKAVAALLEVMDALEDNYNALLAEAKGPGIPETVFKRFKRLQTAMLKMGYTKEEGS